MQCQLWMGSDLRFAAKCTVQKEYTMRSPRGAGLEFAPPQLFLSPGQQRSLQNNSNTKLRSPTCMPCVGIMGTHKINTNKAALIKGRPESSSGPIQAGEVELEPNMTESFIMAAFNRLGQRPLAVKVMRNKFTGEPAGYAFVHFQTDEEAIDTMHKLNGKPIPGTFPVVRFRLNTASREARSNMQSEREFSVWVGDLSPEVDDYSLYRVFASKYSSIKTAKVILDSSGYTKGYGFVRFGSEDEQRNALYAMNGYTGLGSKPLKICTAVPKPKSALTQNASGNSNGYNGQEYNQYYDPSAYWQNYSAWSGYYGQGESAPPTPVDPAQAAAQKAQVDELALVDHKKSYDVDQMNEEFLDPELSLWDSLEASQWFPHEIVECH